MKRIFIVVTSLLLLIQCDDGDFDTPSFVFDNNINNCGNMILYNIGVDNGEALILNTNESNVDNVFFKTAKTDKIINLDNRISYRIFNGSIGANYFCQDIPPSSPSVVNEWNGSGTLIVNNTIVKDDKDDVEETDLEIDTDNDTIPNYIDLDDDNDGILTKNEINADGSFIDTDNDGVPNHLDSDDDGDGVETISELISDTDGDDIPDYLDATTVITQDARNQLIHKYTLSYTMSFVIENMSLSNDSENTINYDNFAYGIKTGNIEMTN